MTTPTTAVAAPKQLPAVVAAVDGDIAEIAKALPKSIPSERFVRIVRTAIQRQPDLLACTPGSVVEACRRAAQDGLLLDGREAALVVYNSKRKSNGRDVLDDNGKPIWDKTATYIPMFQGLIKRAYNSGVVTNLRAGIVYENEITAGRFSYTEGTSAELRHEPLLTDDLGKPVAVYSIATMANGIKSVEIMRVSEIMAIARRSPKNVKDGQLIGIWKSDWAEMAKKTVFRRHTKTLPFDSSTQDVFARMDAMYTNDEGETMPGEIAEPPAEDRPARKKAGGAAEALKARREQAPADDVVDVPAHDPDTGEVIEETGQQDQAGPPTDEPAADDHF